MHKYFNRSFIEETLRYFVCGLSTVLVNIISYKLLSMVWDTLVSNTFAFFIAVCYAFWTNSIFVFRVPCTWKSFCKFMGMRIGMLLIDNGGMLLMIAWGIDDLIAKCVINIIIIGINYIFSKLYIFKKK